MPQILTRIVIVIILGILLSSAVSFSYKYYNTKVAPLNTKLLKKIENKYKPKFQIIFKDYDHQLNLLVKKAKEDYHNLLPKELKTSLVSIYLKKLNRLEQDSDVRFNAVFEAYKKELRQNRLPLKPAWTEQHRYQNYKSEKKSALLKKYRSQLP